MHRHILLATDGSRLSKRSAKEATTLARSLGAQLTAVHVVPARFGFMVNSKTRVELRNAARTDGERYLDEVEALAFRERALQPPAVPERRSVASDHSRRADRALRFDRIAVVFLGSETNKVLANSKIPVLGMPLNPAATAPIAVGWRIPPRS